MGVHNRRFGQIRSGTKELRDQLTVEKAQDPTPLVQIYWAPTQAGMNAVPLVYEPPDKWPVVRNVIKMPRVVRLYSDGPRPGTRGTPDTWIVDGLGPFASDAGFPVTVKGPPDGIGLDTVLTGLGDGTDTVQDVIDEGFAVITSFTAAVPGTGGAATAATQAKWTTAFNTIKATIEAGWKNIFVTVVPGSESKFLELMIPPIDVVDFMGLDVLHIAVEFSRPEVYYNLGSPDYENYKAAVTQNYEFFSRLLTVVYQDVGTPGDNPDDALAFSAFLTGAQEDVPGFIFAGSMNYNDPDVPTILALIKDHFKLKDS